MDVLVKILEPTDGMAVRTRESSQNEQRGALAELFREDRSS